MEGIVKQDTYLIVSSGRYRAVGEILVVRGGPPLDHDTMWDAIAPGDIFTLDRKDCLL